MVESAARNQSVRSWEGHSHAGFHRPHGYIESRRLESGEDWGVATEYVMYQQLALLRLHIWATGAVAKAFNKLAADLAGGITRAAPDPVLEMGQLPGIMTVFNKYLNNWMPKLEYLVNVVRTAAAWIPWGTASRLFAAAMTVGLRQEQVGMGFPTYDPEMPNPDGTKGGWSPVFVNYGPVVRSANERVSQLVTGLGGLRYSDGKNLSDRIWALPSQIRAKALAELITATTNGESAFTAAKRFEQWLAPGAECPRWTSTRLRLTKAEIAAGDARGLYSGNPCSMKGVSYNALRMLRNEIQIAHHAAGDQLINQMPWVEQEQIVLSPDHPNIGCECEDIVAGGEKGDGVYPKGRVLLPIHVQCLCMKIPVMIPMMEMAKRLRGWLEGSQAWPEMDRFANWFSPGRIAPEFIPTNDVEVGELESAESAFEKTGSASTNLEEVMAILADGSEVDIEAILATL